MGQPVGRRNSNVIDCRLVQVLEDWNSDPQNCRRRQDAEDFREKSQSAKGRCKESARENCQKTENRVRCEA
jgi:hypothetical protein